MYLLSADFHVVENRRKLDFFSKKTLKMSKDLLILLEKYAASIQSTLNDVLEKLAANQPSSEPLFPPNDPWAIDNYEKIFGVSRNINFQVICIQKCLLLVSACDHYLSSFAVHLAVCKKRCRHFLFMSPWQENVSWFENSGKVFSNHIRH